MDASIAPLLLFTFVAAMIGTWMELRSSLKPATCSECPHCREVVRLEKLAQEEESRRQAELRSIVSRRYRLDDKDDDPRI